MKKILIASFSILMLAIAGFLIFATVYFKPFVKEQIKTQLANFGYENAEIGDVSVGLYESSIDQVDLKTGSQNSIGSISVTYWPQQLLNKKVNAVKIEDATFDVEIKTNGDVIAAGYTIPKALAPKTDSNVQNASANVPANTQANTPTNTEANTASSTATASGEQSVGGLPFNEIIITNLNLTITSPSGKTIKAKVDAEANPSKKSVSGHIDLSPTNAVALQEIAAIVKPDVATMVSGLSGTVATSMDFNIPNYSDTSKIGGNGTVTVENLNLVKDDIRVQNLNTNMKIENLMPLTIAKGQKLSIAQVNKGAIPVKNISAEFGLDRMKTVSVNSSSFGVAGGTISTNAFNAELNPINTSLVANIQTVDLQTISQLLNVPQLNMKGSLSAALPITMRNGKVIIDQATIQTVLQSAAGQKIQEKANEYIDKKLGDKLDKFIGGGTNNNTAPAGQDGTTQQQQAPKPSDVLNNFLGGFGK